MRYYERERREFVRVKAEVPVRYRFLSHDPAFAVSEFLTGAARDLSGGGLLLVGDIPEPDWIPGLLTERIFVGVEIELAEEDPRPEGSRSTEGEPVRALTRASWVEAAVQGASDECLMGLRFKEITRDDLDRIFKFIIARQMG